MPFYDSSGEYSRQLGKSGNGGRSTRGVNTPSAKAKTGKAQGKGKTANEKVSLNKGTESMKLNKNLAGDNEHSTREKSMQKKKYPGRGTQPKGAATPGARQQTMKAPKSRNLTSGTLF